MIFSRWMFLLGRKLISCIPMYNNSFLSSTIWLQICTSPMLPTCWDGTYLPFPLVLLGPSPQASCRTHMHTHKTNNRIKQAPATDHVARHPGHNRSPRGEKEPS